MMKSRLVTGSRINVLVPTWLGNVLPFCRRLVTSEEITDTFARLRALPNRVVRVKHALDQRATSKFLMLAFARRRTRYNPHGGRA